MIKRARQDLSMERIQKLGEEHRKLVNEFLNSHPVSEETRFIFERIGEYISSSKTAWVFEARNLKGELVAFDVAEFGAGQYGLYMFNFSSEAHYVPGASDLLLYEVIQQAKVEQKRYINLGLGINTGITFFKTKWGGTPFFPYVFCRYRPSKIPTLDSLLKRL
jgi:hypothetical protein